jgi:hypothetical protein
LATLIDGSTTYARRRHKLCALPTCNIAFPVFTLVWCVLLTMARKQDFDLFVAGKTGSFKGID